MAGILERFSLKGRTALVTGAARGIGRGIARGLAEAGALVAIVDRDGEAARGTAGELSAEGLECLALQADVMRRSEVEAAIEALLERWGPHLDVAVNNAGICHNAPSAELAEEDWDRVLDLDLKGVFLCAQAAGRRMIARGSGSIINQDGHILTNNHVVANAQKLTVTLADGSEREGTVVGSDPENDLAIIKIDPRGKKLVTIPFGNSGDLLVGNKVLAIGNPFGLERTLTTGIVSGLGRPIRVNQNYVIREMIQTDAAINPGNSGGPLLNTRGELVGINTMIYSPSGGSVGIGFAVPIDIAKRVVPDLIRSGKVDRGWIDVTPVQLFPALVDYAKLPVAQGLLVSEVSPGGLAEKAGIIGGNRAKGVRYRGNMIYLGGDVIIEVNGLAISGIQDLYAALEDSKPGKIVAVKVNRGGRVVDLKVQLARRPKPSE